MLHDLKPVQSIIIVGGGTSGWMAAAYLSKTLRDVNITLVESSSIPRIGVGEATFPFIRKFLKRIGLNDDRLWMSECDATFKTGILYKDWANIGDQYWHPLLEELDYVSGQTHVGHCWLHYHKRGHPAFQEKASFYESCFSTMPLNVMSHKIPAARDYAYHLDATLFAQLLQRMSPEVKHLLDDVSTVRLDEKGDIDALVTENSGELKADLYIDCTGFKRHLISKVAPNQPFISYADVLLCNSAVVLHPPYNEDGDLKEQMPPYLECRAQQAGWIWTIPLFSQRSSGYVYANGFLSEDEAELTLRQYWGLEQTRDLSCQHLKFESGRLERSWVKNCVAVGLSGGFVEPLESPGLAIGQMAIEMLASMLDARFYEDRMIARFNSYVEKFYADIVQFLISHYYFSLRDDSQFWQAVRNDLVLPADLSARLTVFRKLLPTFSTKGTSEVWMFGDLSWFSVLLGMNFDFDPAEVDSTSLVAFNLLLKDKGMAVEDLKSSLPNHYVYLRDHVYGRELR